MIFLGAINVRWDRAQGFTAVCLSLVHPCGGASRMVDGYTQGHIAFGTALSLAGKESNVEIIVKIS